MVITRCGAVVNRTGVPQLSTETADADVGPGCAGATAPALQPARAADTTTVSARAQTREAVLRRDNGRCGEWLLSMTDLRAGLPGAGVAAGAADIVG
ncbi:hypothetical protein GCM10027052_12980 [Parafrigoribacterium mesophilum]